MGFIRGNSEIADSLPTCVSRHACIFIRSRREEINIAVMRATARVLKERGRCAEKWIRCATYGIARDNKASNVIEKNDGAVICTQNVFGCHFLYDGF